MGVIVQLAHRAPSRCRWGRAGSEWFSSDGAPHTLCNPNYSSPSRLSVIPPTFLHRASGARCNRSLDLGCPCSRSPSAPGRNRLSLRSRICPGRGRADAPANLLVRPSDPRHQGRSGPERSGSDLSSFILVAVGDRNIDGPARHWDVECQRQHRQLSSGQIEKHCLCLLTGHDRVA